MSKKSVWFGALALVVIIGSCNAANRDDSSTTSTPAASGSTASSANRVAPPTFTPAAVAPDPEPAGEVVTVARVIDGDTFELSDGRRVRVLGIDSCEMGTHGGDEAKLAAEGQLMNPYNGVITMTAEPGVDTDRNGRLLRYVQLDSGKFDFGEHMVKYDHTGVYQGDNDASDAYVQRMYAADLEYAMKPPSGRECSDPYAEYRDDSGGGSGDGDDDDRGRRGGACGRFNPFC